MSAGAATSGSTSAAAEAEAAREAELMDSAFAAETSGKLHFDPPALQYFWDVVGAGGGILSAGLGPGEHRELGVDAARAVAEHDAALQARGEASRGASSSFIGGALDALALGGVGLVSDVEDAKLVTILVKLAAVLAAIVAARFVLRKTMAEDE